MKRLFYFLSILGVFTLGACDDDSSKSNNANNVNNVNNVNNINNINNVNNGTPCQTMCAALMACETITDKELVFGTSAQTCETKCEGTLEPYIQTCLLAATDCAGYEECMRCQVYADVTYCDDACELLVTDCGGEDLSQCGIDCEMYSSGAAGCFRGAGRMCWEAAVETGLCADFAGCPTIH